MTLQLHAESTKSTTNTEVNTENASDTQDEHSRMSTNIAYSSDHTYSGCTSGETSTDGNFGVPDHTYFQCTIESNSHHSTMQNTVECEEYGLHELTQVSSKTNDTPETESCIVYPSGCDQCFQYTYLHPSGECELLSKNNKAQAEMLYGDLLNENINVDNISDRNKTGVHHNVSVTDWGLMLPDMMGNNMSTYSETHVQHHEESTINVSGINNDEQNEDCSSLSEQNFEYEE